HIGKDPAKLDGVLASAAADLQYVAATSRQQAREHREDRLVIAMEGGRVQAAVRGRRRRTVFAELSDVPRRGSLVVRHDQPLPTTASWQTTQSLLPSRSRKYAP